MPDSGPERGAWWLVNADNASLMDLLESRTDVRLAVPGHDDAVVRAPSDRWVRLPGAHSIALPETHRVSKHGRPHVNDDLTRRVA